MSHHSMISDKKAQFLRRNAVNRLRAGSAPVNGAPLDGDTLTLLHEMASDPERSSDALRLLHELQVYQVELDLQRTQLESIDREVRHELARHKALFALIPTACLAVTMEGRVVDANPAAADLLGAGRGELPGQELLAFLKPESHASWSGLLRKLYAGEPSGSCEVFVDTDADEAITLSFSATVSTEGDVLLLATLCREPVLHDLSTLQRAQ